MTTTVLFGVLVVLVLFYIFKPVKKVKSPIYSSGPITYTGGGGGTFDGGSGQNNDGSVTPPKPEGENAQ